MRPCKTAFLTIVFSLVMARIMEKNFLYVVPNCVYPFFFQSRSDSYRIVLYNVDSVVKIQRPLLVQRHNVIPGMFLVGGKFSRYRYIG